MSPSPLPDSDRDFDLLGSPWKTRGSSVLRHNGLKSEISLLFLRLSIALKLIKIIL